MQNAVPNGEGGMLAVLGKSVEEITKILNENSKIFYVLLLTIIQMVNLLLVEIKQSKIAKQRIKFKKY